MASLGAVAAGAAAAAGSKRGILLYGATGLTGRLIAKRISQLGLPATLAGRSREKLESLQELLKLPVEVVDLSETSKLQALVAQHKVVLHVAGPFTRTALPMLQACCNTGTHYLDVTGELGVIELVKSHDPLARKNGIMLMPAVGFDCVPGDCAAALATKALPSADQLHLGCFLSASREQQGSKASAGAPRVSRGTLLSGALYVLPLGGRELRDGKLIPSSFAAHHRKFVVSPTIPPFQTMSFPAAELLITACSTSIPRIITYVPDAIGLRGWLMNWVFRFIAFMFTTWPFSLFLPNLLQGSPVAAELSEGVSKATRMGVAAEAVDSSTGKVARAAVFVGEGYDFTAAASVEIARRILDGEFKPGFQTPSLVFGPDFARSLPDVEYITSLD